MDEKEKTGQVEQQNEQDPKGENTFTQEDVNNFVKREVEKALKKAAKQQEKETPASQTAAETQTDPPTSTTLDPEKETLRRDLLLARAQVDAVREGVSPSVVEDAVYLALRGAEEADELDEDGIREALKEVLTRHPEWKGEKDKKAGFKVGAEGGKETPGNSKALPTGRVIF